jgi:hypothetical protein
LSKKAIAINPSNELAWKLRKKIESTNINTNLNDENNTKNNLLTKKHTNEKAVKFILVLVILIAFYVICSQNYYDSNRNKQEITRIKTPSELRKERIEKCFSAWDGSHRGLTAVIKAGMNDPDSYKHVKTLYSDHGDYLIVETTFRGRNAFGGVVTNWVQAKVDLDGNVLSIIAKGP